MRTPGMIGLSGKWPGKKLSLIVTFFIATAETPGLYSITLSTNKKGNLKEETRNKVKSLLVDSQNKITNVWWVELAYLWGKISRILLISMTFGNAGYPTKYNHGQSVTLSILVNFVAPTLLIKCVSDIDT